MAQHICDEERFEEFSNFENQKLNLANHDSTKVKTKGTVKIATTDGNVARSILENTLHVPDLRNNLMSVAKITDAGNSVTFTRERAAIKNNLGEEILVTHRKRNLYLLNELDNESAWTVSATTYKPWTTIWHERFGHLNYHDLLEISKKGAVSGLHLKNDGATSKCEICSKAKITIQ